MIHKKSQKIIAGLLCCVLCILTGVFSVLAVTNRTIGKIKGLKTYANGHVIVEDLEDAVEFSRMDESFFAPDGDNYFKYNDVTKDWIMPGGSKSGSLTVENKSHIALTMGMYAESTGPTRLANKIWEQDPTAKPPFTPDNGIYQEFKDYVTKNYPDLTGIQALRKAGRLQDMSERLVGRRADEKNGIEELEGVLDLVVYKNDNGSKVKVYEGKLNGKGELANAGSSLYPDQMGINFGKLKPGEKAEYTFTLTAPKEMGNEFANSIALIDWIFNFAYSEAPSQTETTTTTTSTTTTTTTTTTTKAPIIPGTGEPMNLYALAAVACGVSALVIFFIAFGNTGKRRKEEEES